MLDPLSAFGLIAVSTLFGAMAFFSAVVAPLVFVKLEAATAGRFIRALFPWYYLVVLLLSALAAATLAPGRGVEAAVMGLVLLGAILSRQVLMPRINELRDRELAGDADAGKRFARLHRLSVWINGLQMLAALAVLLRLALG